MRERAKKDLGDNFEVVDEIYNDLSEDGKTLILSYFNESDRIALTYPEPEEFDKELNNFMNSNRDDVNFLISLIKEHKAEYNGDMVSDLVMYSLCIPGLETI